MDRRREKRNDKGQTKQHTKDQHTTQSDTHKKSGEAEEETIMTCTEMGTMTCKNPKWTHTTENLAIECEK